MNNSICIKEINIKSFCANIYSVKHFRMIGLVDVNIEYDHDIEQVTLAYYSSSGTNNGKIKGLWYPIIGIKTTTGEFTEFTEYLNFVLTNTTEGGLAEKGWLAKSLFFYGDFSDNSKIMGFSNGSHYEKLLEIGRTLKDLYDKDEFCKMNYLDPGLLNQIVISNNLYRGNKHKQRENYERFMGDVFIQTQNSLNAK
ncbi:hypothetical protein CLNEO_01060 [Anaerotignum neopropionicum]|uniref:Uncharacterized protein n=1 Tax=Anaerotignum neopropionicum TaxID=36847 RepID=A0A136WI05_9FIRM|nr:hypothetical protein [Anaerotignum neopropionicum]KXL54010.1 hypothetical protein CLNEO_01060 [Anaerotignum neopropionicum]